MRFYQVDDDLSVVGRWVLGSAVTPDGRAVDEYQFTEGIRVSVSGPLVMDVRCEGDTTDFTLAAFDVPVVSERVASALAAFDSACIQRIPVLFNRKLAEHFDILNVAKTVKCLDETRSDIQWRRDDNDSLDNAGGYQMVAKKVIRSDLAVDHPIFRLEGWSIALVVREDVKDALETLGVTGIVFIELETS